MKTKYKIISLIVLFTLLSAVLLLWHYTTPKIKTLSSNIVKNYDTIVIKGNAFGNEMKNSSVLIDKKKIPLNSYIEWTNNKIKIKMLKEMKSGFLAVSTDFGTSNYKLINKKEEIEIKKDDIFLTRIDTKAIEIKRGKIISITGSNIPFNKGKNKIFFPTLISEKTPLNEDNYISWTQNSIQIEIPDFVKNTGVITVNIQKKEFEIPYKLKDEINFVKLLGKKEFELEYKDQYDFSKLNWEHILNFYSFRIRFDNYRNQIVEYEKKDFKNYKKLEFTELNVKNKSRIDKLKIKTFAYKIEINNLDLIKKEYKKNDEYKKYTKMNGADKNIIAKIKEEFSTEDKDLHPFEKAKKLFLITYNYYKLANEKKKKVYLDALSEVLREEKIPSKMVYTYKSVNSKLKKNYYLEFYLQDFMWIPIEMKEDGFAKLDNDNIIFYKEGDSIKVKNFQAYPYKEIIDYKDGHFDLIVSDENQEQNLKEYYTREYSINEKS